MAPDPHPVRSLCVYCGSSVGRDPRDAAEAAAVGALLAANGIRLVYGGGDVGLMGVVADAVMAGGGEVLGVIPVGLFETEQGHRGITELVEVRSMHERKARMAAESDAFLALPGGLGTLEELAEILTWAQLGIHAHPVGVLNTGGFWDPLLTFLDGAQDAGFLRPANRGLLREIRSVDTIIEVLAAPLVAAPPVLAPEES
ncbi:MAG: TIGR00730 family Rossman fold protein [Acidobacteria bacterium]|nr:TIGR00730 family Rossman fold protein [Acidobacteriota bacterium]